METTQSNMDVGTIPTGRVICKFDTKGDRLKKTRSLEGLSDVGDVVEACSAIAAIHAGEIFLNNFTATLYNQGPIDLRVLQSIRESVSLPLIYEGGLKTLEQATSLIEGGADRLAVNSHSYEDPEFLRVLSDAFGSQAVVASVTTRKIGDEYCLFSHMGRERVNLDFSSWLDKLSQVENVEVSITNIETEGSGRGFPKDLLNLASEHLDLSRIIVCGGMGTEHQINELFDEFPIAAVMSASLFRQAILCRK